MPLVSPSCRLVFAALVRRRCLEAGWPSEAAGRAELVAAELAGNAVKHAGGGLGSAEWRGDRLLITVEDEGAELKAAHFNDGWTGAGALGPDEHRDYKGLGCGLGAVARMAEGLEVRGRPEGGKRLLALLSVRWGGPEGWRERISGLASG